MSVLKKTNNNYDRFISHRSDQQSTRDYFEMKEHLDYSTKEEDATMVDASDDSGNNEMTYNALLQSEILDIGDSVHLNNEPTNENMPTSLSCLQKFSKSRKNQKNRLSIFDVNTDTLFSQ